MPCFATLEHFWGCFWSDPEGMILAVIGRKKVHKKMRFAGECCWCAAGVLQGLLEFLWSAACMGRSVNAMSVAC